MRSIAIGLFVLAASTLTSHVVQSAQWCAQYDNGTSDCGIPTLASCQQSVSGVGGVCVPDRRSQMRNRASRNQQPAPFPLLFPDMLAPPNGNRY
jgi:hypothetical protein